ncbi:hypothetical protein KHA90_16015 [Flavobacterium psychroterrae]|uniref:DUF5977 domain-containing protein n=1 Tax=Flavobacterium psychroterrae TaxID=2133767 RepID=A0ABS5PE16_9FLAO|nr:DUF5977 domain-containing protein [Flavobacterium psychroterrae]MBS7232524.1 hypothetical protein [Flavobacterium psychroterrae]
MKIKFIILFILLNLNLYSQKSTEYDYNIPLPPESYQFKKRLLNNVSLYTGQPSINIPIYSINLDGVEVPISISYNTGGIKVEEDATSVGLGWSLNIGGQITRNNHGAPDERFFIHQDYSNKNTFGIGRLKTSIDPTESSEWNCNNDAEHGSRMQFYAKAFLAGNDVRNIYGNDDSRPDEFYYSFFGHSGKFMFNQELKKFITFPLDDITINYELGKLSTIPQSNFFDNFNVKLPNGYNLILGKDGTSSISQYGLTPFDQSWQLKRIISPNNKEIIYNYISANYMLYTNLGNHVSQIIVRSSREITGSSYESNITGTKEKLISEIIFPSGKMNFIYGDRLDLQTGAKKLEKIEVYDISNNLIRKIELVQSYFNSNLHLFSKDEVNKRLKLDAVKFYDTKNTVVENYNFDYYLFDKIPSKYSKAQDHWGYFNGKETNFSLFPENLLPEYHVEGSYGFNRDVDTLYTKTFSLKSIKFPEGGVKYYDYENHKCLTGATTANYFDAISDERYALKQASLTISGYALNYYYPAPNEVNMFNKVFYSEPLETSIYSTSLKSNEVNLLIRSNLPFQVPNYRNINAEFNKVEFYLQEKQGDGTYKDIKYQGTISKDEHPSGNINSYFDLGGKGSYRMKVVVTQNYLLSDSKDYNNYHNTSFILKYRDKVRDDVKVGGLRIKNIQTYTDENLNSAKYTTYFKYLNDDKITSGKMMNVPSYVESISLYVFDGIHYEPGQGGHSTQIEDQLGIRLSSSSTLPLYKTSGSNVGYTKVSQIDYDNINKTEIKEDNYFSFKEPLFSEIPLFDDRREDEPQEWHRGKLLRKVFYNDKDIVKEEAYDYYGKEVEKNRGYVDEINYELMDQNQLCTGNSYVSKHIFPLGVSFPNILKDIPKYALNSFAYDGIYAANKYTIENYAPKGLKIPYFKIYTGFDKLKSKTVKNYFTDGIVVESEEYLYNNLPYNIELTSVKSTTSKNSEILESKYFYPQDPEMASEPFAQELIAANRIGTPLNTQAFRSGNKLSEQKTVYDKSIATSNLLLPKYILENKGAAALNAVIDKKISYDLYDDKGNVLQYTQEGATPVSIVWGYNKTLPVVKIENLAYKTIPVNLINEVQTASSDKGSETNMATALAKYFYNFSIGLSNTMITTYMYKPLVGVSRIVDVTNQATYYDYDSFNRLKFVKDWQGNVLESYCYNYKGQIMDCSLNVAPVYSNVAISKSYDKYNCPLGQVGPVIFSVSAGNYTSLISQADADAQALVYLDKQGQLNANRSSYCVFMNTEISHQFNKNNCSSGAVTSAIMYLVPARKYYSYVSQAEADKQAQNDIDKNGQIYANTNGACIFKNNALSRLFTKNDCEINGIPPDAIFYVVEAGKYISKISQQDADLQALYDIEQNGQEYANVNSKCIYTYKNIEIHRSFRKNDCPPESILPDPVSYKVEAGKYISNISQEEADNLAKAELQQSGQNFANTNTVCKMINCTVVMSDSDSNMSMVWITVTAIPPSNDPITINVRIAYQYQINKIGYYSKDLILPAGQKTKTFQVPLTFIGAAELDSFTVK